uniref:Secreted protein n=1 Tax=Heterorhabditis bacteriophora TaxID=37862 RepID=A0A1I7WK74_HETBA
MSVYLILMFFYCAVWLLNCMKINVEDCIYAYIHTYIYIYIYIYIYTYVILPLQRDVSHINEHQRQLKY